MSEPSVAPQKTYAALSVSIISQKLFLLFVGGTHRREGQGTEVVVDEAGLESKYVGAWVDNTMQGKGVTTFSNGNVYEGGE